MQADSLIRVVGVPGRLVRDPQTRRIVDDSGITVSAFDTHWVRMIADGDVAIAPVDLEAVLAPVLDESGVAINPPAGDLAADLANPAEVKE